MRGVQALALSMWAEYVGASVFFARGWASDRYYSPQLGESAWEQHFEPPFGVTTGQVRVGRGVGRGRERGQRLARARAVDALVFHEIRHLLEARFRGLGVSHCYLSE